MVYQKNSAKREIILNNKQIIDGLFTLKITCERAIIYTSI